MILYVRARAVFFSYISSCPDSLGVLDPLLVDRANTYLHHLPSLRFSPVVPVSFFLTHIHIHYTSTRSAYRRSRTKAPTHQPTPPLSPCVNGRTRTRLIWRRCGWFRRRRPRRGSSRRMPGWRGIGARLMLCFGYVPSFLPLFLHFFLPSFFSFPFPNLFVSSSSGPNQLLSPRPHSQFCSTLPMGMILPPSIRPYWSHLLAEKHQSPPHRAWEYSSDPFAAKREVEKRQAVRVSGAKQRALAAGGGAGDGKGGGGGAGAGAGGRDGWDDGFAAGAAAAGNGNTRESAGGGGGGGRGWNHVPEVKMSQNQREVVEGVIRSVSLLDSFVLALFWFCGSRGRVDACIYDWRGS